MRDRAQLLAICIDRGGYVRGARVAQFIVEWEVAVRNVGRDVGLREFGRWWKATERTCFRRVAEFRAMFPELGPQATPSALMGPLLERLALDQAAEDVPLDLAAFA